MNHNQSQVNRSHSSDIGLRRDGNLMEWKSNTYLWGTPPSRFSVSLEEGPDMTIHKYLLQVLQPSSNIIWHISKFLSPLVANTIGCKPSFVKESFFKYFAKVRLHFTSLNTNSGWAQQPYLRRAEQSSDAVHCVTWTCRYYPWYSGLDSDQSQT